MTVSDLKEGMYHLVFVNTNLRQYKRAYAHNECYGILKLA